MKSGTLFLEPPVEGVHAGGWFSGDGTVTYHPTTQTTRAVMATELGHETIEEARVTAAYIYSLGGSSFVPAFAAAHPEAAAGNPDDMNTYQADKSAMRQLGFKLTSMFMDCDGPAAGATWVLFPMESIRIPHSEEARLLYTFDPTRPLPVSLSVFGHEEMVAVKPYKFRFYPLSTSPAQEPRTRGTDSDPFRRAHLAGHHGEVGQGECDAAAQARPRPEVAAAVADDPDGGPERCRPRGSPASVPAVEAAHQRPRLRPDGAGLARGYGEYRAALGHRHLGGNTVRALAQFVLSRERGRLVPQAHRHHRQRRRRAGSGSPPFRSSSRESASGRRFRTRSRDRSGP